MIAKQCEEHGGVCKGCPHNPIYPGALKLCEFQDDEYIRGSEYSGTYTHYTPAYIGYRRFPRESGITPAPPSYILSNLTP